ncbi:MAG: hypothetical protein ACI4QD_04105 [Kiritimatiellia bacterium]
MLPRASVVSACLALASALAASADPFTLDGGGELALDEPGTNRKILFWEAESFGPLGEWKVDIAHEADSIGCVWGPMAWWKKRDKVPRPASGLKSVRAIGGTLARRVELPFGGRWRLWICYNNRMADFRPAVQTPEGEILVQGKQWNDRHTDTGCWTWGALDFNAKGRIDITLQALSRGAQIDCLLLTDDRSYLPDVRDFNPLYVRFKLPRNAPAPLKFDDGRWGQTYPPVKPGETSPWHDCSRRYPFGTTDFIEVTATPTGKKKPQSCPFTVEYSTNRRDVCKQLVHTGPGRKVRGLILRSTGGIKSDVELSQADLDRARLASPNPAPMPKRYGLASLTTFTSSDWNPQAIENELQTFRHIGLNQFAKGPLQRRLVPDPKDMPDFVDDWQFVWAACKGCDCTPDDEAIRRTARMVAERNAQELAAGKRVVWNILDELNHHIYKVFECRSQERKCQDRFIDFLKQKGVKPEDLGKGSWSDVNFSLEPKAGILAYWTVRYRDYVVASFFRRCTELAGEAHRNLLPTGNMGTELVFSGNLLQGGMNLFEMCNSGSMRHILTEDWANLQLTYQHCSYQTDVLRAAGRRRGAAASMLNIIAGRSDREIAAKAFSEAGRGVKGQFFFRYGPDYTGASDASNLDPRIYRGIWEFARATAGVEDYLLDGSPLQGDAGLLLSETGESWNLILGDSGRGKDRMVLSLLLNHLGVRTDVLNEDDLSDRLKVYRHLFVMDGHIRRSCLGPLEEWLRGGGTLILGPEALVADEANAPLDCARLERAGRVVRLKMHPHKEYLLASTSAGRYPSNRNWPEEPRKQMRALLSSVGIRPAIQSDNPLVEAQIVESPHGRLVVLSNWSFTPCRVRLTGSALKKPLEAEVDYGTYVRID